MYLSKFFNPLLLHEASSLRYVFLSEFLSLTRRGSVCVPPRSTAFPTHDSFISPSLRPSLSRSVSLSLTFVHFLLCLYFSCTNDVCHYYQLLRPRRTEDARSSEKGYSRLRTKNLPTYRLLYYART